MNRGHIVIALRILAIIVAFVMWGLSVHFSVNGFGIEVPDQAWIGIVLAICVTAIELIWNQQGTNHGLTIKVVGIAAYAYGIWTNMLGILQAQGVMSNFFGEPTRVIFPFILGLFLEITPEPLLIWGLIEDNMGDFLENIFSGIHLPRKRGVPSMMMNRPPMPPPGVRPSPLHIRPNPNGHRPVKMGRFEE